jgi:broad specificity phosphatase PhoE
MRSMHPAYVESNEELTARVWSARAYLKKELDAGKRIAVVTHSYFIREVMKQLQGVGRVIDNCEVLTVDPSAM